MNRHKILIVDDDHDMLDLLEIFLYKDYDVLTAINGFDGLKKAEEELPTIVISDIKMPVMDGIKLHNTMRKNKALEKIPVIAITSFIQEHTIKSLKSLGFTAVIPKPPDQKFLLETILSIIASGENNQSTSR